VSAVVFGSELSPAKSAAPGSVARSSTCETRLVLASFKAKSESSEEIAGTTVVPG
jgi:hypothetical protein